MQILGTTGKRFTQQEQGEEEELALGLSKLINSESQMILYSKRWLSGEGAPALICIKVVGKVFVMREQRCVQYKPQPLDHNEPRLQLWPGKA